VKTIGRQLIVASLGALFCWGVIPAQLLAQSIQVTSANPNAAPQGTINLNVAVGGNGFKKGAKAAFFLSGTTNPDGVTVNSTSFNSSSQVTANITISDTTSIANFDIQVTNSDGRTGKGSQLFAVTAKGTPIGCTTLGTPSAFSLVTTLNYINASGVPEYTGSFGGTIRVRPVTLTFGGQYRTVMVAAVSNNAGGNMEFFILDPATGEVLDGQPLFSGGPVQPHITVIYDPTHTIGARAIAVGDLNADGIPDFVIGSRLNNIAFAFLDSVTNGVLSYSAITIPAPSGNSGRFGAGVAMGNLDGLPGDELAVGDSGSGTGHNQKLGKVFIYRFNGSGLDLIGTPVESPATIGFGFSVAIGDVTGDGVPDLIVGGGTVYVFPAPLSSTFSYALTTGVSGDGLGTQLAAGHLSSSGATDVVATTSAGSSDVEVAVFAGPIASNRTSPTFTFPAYSGLSTTGWATGFDAADIDGDALGGIEALVGVPNASNSGSCKSPGAAEVYFSNPLNPSQPTLYVFQPPVIDSTTGSYGWGVGAVPATPGNPPLLLVGETAQTLGGVANAGQVYVYKKN